MDIFTSSSYIRTIAESRNISAAADKLGISQPALSSYLKKVENQVGALLFDRTKQPLELTEAGKIYLYHASRHDAINKEFRQQIADLHELKTGRIVVGGAGAFNISYLPGAVAAFSLKYPGIDIRIIDGKVPEIAEKALNGEVDIFIAPSKFDEDKFAYENLFKEKIFLCLPPQWEINRKLKNTRIDVSHITAHLNDYPLTDFREFSNMPFVLLNEEQHIGQTMTYLFDKYNVSPVRAIHTEQTTTSYGLTLAGVGISLMTESTIRNSNLKNHAAYYHVDDEICTRQMYVVYPKHKYITRAAMEFLTVLKAFAQNC